MLGVGSERGRRRCGNVSLTGVFAASF